MQERTNRCERGRRGARRSANKMPDGDSQQVRMKRACLCRASEIMHDCVSGVVLLSLLWEKAGWGAVQEMLLTTFSAS